MNRVLTLTCLLLLIYNVLGVKWVHTVFSSQASTQNLPPRSKFSLTPFWPVSGIGLNYIFISGVDPNYSGELDQYTFLNITDISLYYTLPNSTVLTKENALYIYYLFPRYYTPSGAVRGDFWVNSATHNFTTSPFYSWATSTLSGSTSTLCDGSSLVDGVQYNRFYQSGGLRPSSNEVFGIQALLNLTTIANFYSALETNYYFVGHTSVYQYNSLINLDDSTYALGRMVIFGGFDGTSVVNNLLACKVVHSSTDSSQTTLLTLTGDYPSPRMYHTALTYNGSNYMIIFGGTNGNGTYFNDIYVLDLSQDLVRPNWNKTVPISSSIPAPRAGHTMLFKNSYEEDAFYIFGGESTNGEYLNDLWKFNISEQSWTQLTYNQPAPTPRAYHQGGVVSYDGGTLMFFFGGQNSSSAYLDTFEVVDLDQDCEYYCQDSYCSTYAQCVESFSCLSGYMCNLTCIDDPSNCVTSCTDSQVACWNGICVSNLSDCSPYPSCEPTEKRCSDGLCYSELTSCNSNVSCSSGQVVGPDGKCRDTQIHYFGCLPNGYAVQCYDGTCASTFAECNTLNCTGSNVTCYAGCYVASDCQLADCTQEIHDFQISSFDSTDNSITLFIYLSVG